MYGCICLWWISGSSSWNVCSKISPIFTLLNFIYSLKWMGKGRWYSCINFSEILIFFGSEQVFGLLTYLPWTADREFIRLELFISSAFFVLSIARTTEKWGLNVFFSWETALEPPNRVTGMYLWAWERFTQRWIAILLMGNSVNGPSSTL